MATLLDEFRSITEALNDAGIDYAICRGWAMAIHGLPRATIDIDLLILGEDLERTWSLTRGGAMTSKDCLSISTTVQSKFGGFRK